MKKFIHVRERISLNCKKWTCNVRRALFSPVLKDNTAILNNKNCVSTRFLLVFLMLLFLLDLIDLSGTVLSFYRIRLLHLYAYGHWIYGIDLLRICP